MKSFTVDVETLLTVAAAVLDANGVLLSANPGFLRLLPAECTPPIGARVERYFIQPGFAALVAAIDKQGSDGYRGLLSIGDPDGKMRTLRGRVWRLDTDLCLLAEYDIADLERLNDTMLELHRDASLAQRSLAQSNVRLKVREGEMLESSFTDALTGVGNRRRLDQALASEISRVRRSDGTLSVIMADIDHFKLVNDLRGHGAGDKVLVYLGALFKSHTRPTDIVARYGGEEFVVLLPQAGLGQAVLKAEQFRNSLAARPIEPLTQIVTASFGVVELAPREEAESVLRRADQALYKAKEDGRNRVVAAGYNRPG
jgi:diguanylate cyclase (GGDEF)-like protein